MCLKHKWRYDTLRNRTCEKCGKHQWVGSFNHTQDCEEYGRDVQGYKERQEKLKKGREVCKYH